MVSLADDLAPSELCDLVKVLSDKLKATRDQLQLVQTENERLQAAAKLLSEPVTENEKENVAECDFASCS